MGPGTWSERVGEGADVHLGTTGDPLHGDCGQGIQYNRETLQRRRKWPVTSDVHRRGEIVMRVGRGRMATQQQERQPVLKEARGSGEMRSGDGVGGRSNPDWQRRRGELNHDWLKGRYIPDLD